MRTNRNYKGAAVSAVLICSWPGNAQVKPQPARGVTPALARQTTANVEQIVHDYLLEHPEVLIQSIQRFQQRYKAEEADQKRDAIGKLQQELHEDGTSPI